MKTWMTEGMTKTIGRRMTSSSLKRELRSVPMGQSEAIKHPSQPDHRTKSEHSKDELTNLSILRNENSFVIGHMIRSHAIQYVHIWSEQQFWRPEKNLFPESSATTELARKQNQFI